MTTDKAIVLRGGRVVDPCHGTVETRDVWLVGGRIAAPASIHAADRKVDATGLVVAPAFWDVHVHLREPGNEDAETIASGTEAARRGGFGTVVAMPNTSPPLDTADRLREQQARAAADALVRVLWAGCLTEGRDGARPADIAAMADAGAVAFTDDGTTVADENVMTSAMAAAHAAQRVVLDHALDPKLAGRGSMHDGDASRRNGQTGIPSEAEERIVERDIRLCRDTGCRLHVQHVSCAGAVDLIRAARREGLPVTGEATPHHLWFTDEDAARGGTSFKMNPPLRAGTDRQAILDAVFDGTLSVLATDHAPHTAARKAKPFADAPFGVLGLETAVGATWTVLGVQRGMDVIEWVRRWTAGPAEVLGMPCPSMEEGEAGGVVLLDLGAEWRVWAAEFASLSRNTPFEGVELTGRVIALERM